MGINCEVFISYSSKEKETADLVRECLENNGITCWMAPESIPIGSGYAGEITEAIKNSKMIVLILSSAAMSSKWVEKEVDFAISENKPLLPFHIDDTDLNSVFKLYLNNVQRIEAYRRIKMALSDLLENVTALIGKKEHNSAKIYLKPTYREPNFNLIGRDEEIKTLFELFSKTNIVSVSGIGGIGKSEITKAFAKEASIKNFYNVICFVDYNTSLKKTIAGLDFANFDEISFIDQVKSRNDFTSLEDALFTKKASWLEETKKDTLLVIDGFDNIDDENIKLLSRLSCHVLISTRCVFNDFACLKAEKISEDNLIKLFYQYYHDGDNSSLEKEKIKEVIKIVNGHTLTIKLIAEFLETTGYDLDTVISELKKNALSQVFEEDEVEHNHEYKNINRHINNLFVLSNLNDEEREVLSELAILPSYGVRKYLFKKWSPNPKTMTIISKLNSQGWVESNQGFILLHPLVKAVIKDNVKPSTSTLKPFILNVLDALVTSEVPTLNMLDEMNDIGLSLISNLSDEDEFMVKILAVVAKFYGEVIYYKLYSLKSKECTNVSFFQASFDTLDKISEFKTCNEMMKKAYALAQKVKIDNHLLGDVYAVLASSSFNIKNYLSAVDYNTKALDAYLKVLEENDPIILRTKRRRGTNYYYLGEYEKSYNDYNDNLMTRLKYIDKEDPSDLGRSYMYVGNALNKLDRFEEAYLHYQKAYEYGSLNSKNSIGLADLSISIYEMLIKIGKIDEAKLRLNQALDAYETYTSNEERIKEIKNILSRIEND